jgi:hypothetical protein
MEGDENARGIEVLEAVAFPSQGRSVAVPYRRAAHQGSLL